jgi:pyrroline-5-carboxylate reductase
MSELSEVAVALLGGGAMGEALAAGVLAAGAARERLVAADPDEGRRKHLTSALGIRTTAGNREALAAGAAVAVLAVKPGLVKTVLAELGGPQERGLARPLWISIAAGVPLATLASGLPDGTRIVRAMPNTPALVRAGATAYTANEHCTQDDRALANALFRAIGVAWECPSEALLDAVTGLSGSGPAYVFVLLEALSDAGVRMGLPRDAATALATQTVLGSALLAQTTGRHPAALKDQVTSPGGTTIAGLERLEALGFRAAIHEAVAAATRRSRELGGA